MVLPGISASMTSASEMLCVPMDSIRLCRSSSPSRVSAPKRALSPISTGKRLAISSNRSEEHTSELQSLMRISYAVFCLKKKKTNQARQQKSQNTKTKDTPSYAFNVYTENTTKHTKHT